MRRLVVLALFITLFPAPASASPSAWVCESSANFVDGLISGTPTASSTARCSRNLAVQPGATYTLTARVRGGYTFLGHDYGVTWAPPGPNWTTLTTSFTATTSSIQIYIHGWYAQSPYFADSVTLTGRPAAPADLAPVYSTSHAQKLRWTASPGATGYRVYRDGTFIQQSTSTESLVDGLSPATSYSYTVTAVNQAGESAPSNVMQANTAARYDQVPPATRSVVGTPQAYQVWLAWEAVMTGTDGYNIYQDGVLAGWSYGPSFTATGLQHGTYYTFEITALNSAGESAKSTPLTVYTWQVPS